MSLNVDKNTECVQTCFYDRRGTFRYRCMRHRCLRYRCLRYREFTAHGYADKLDTNEFLQKDLIAQICGPRQSLSSLKVSAQGS